MQAKNVPSGSGWEFGINSNEDTKLASASCVYKEDPDFSNMTEDEQIAHAMQISMQENEMPKNKNEEKKSSKAFRGQIGDGDRFGKRGTDD